MSFGESHGKCIGMVVDGCPAGLPLDETDIQADLDLRKPGQSMITSQRKEEDKVELISGVFGGFTTGAPVCMVIWNKDSDSRPYDLIKTKPRPGHSDYPAMIKYGGYADYRGSGRFSGRLTASFVMAGAISKKLLKYVLGVETIAYTIKIGEISMGELSFEKAKAGRYNNEVRCPDTQIAEKMKDSIMNARKSGNSLGGIIECVSTGLPVGLGEPVFSSLESDLSKALFSIPAVKAIEFGSGFEGTKRTGYENNDLFINEDGKVVT